MNAKRVGQIREVIFAGLTSLVSFELLPESWVADLAAIGLALVVVGWGIISKGSITAAAHSLIRKALQSLAAIAAMAGWLEGPQAAALLQTVTLIGAAAWSWEQNDDGPERLKRSGSRRVVSSVALLTCAIALSGGMTSCGSFSGTLRHDDSGAKMAIDRDGGRSIYVPGFGEVYSSAK